jgi:hypothetical protein
MTLEWVAESAWNAWPNAVEYALFCDDLDYQAPVIAEGVDTLGQKRDIPNPWKAGYHTNFNSYPPTDPTDCYRL